MRRLNEIAPRRGQKLAQLALQWVLRDDRVTSAVIGASSVEQLDTNLDALAGPPLTDDELAAIDKDAVDVRHQPLGEGDGGLSRSRRSVTGGSPRPASHSWQPSSTTAASRPPASTSTT